MTHTHEEYVAFLVNQINNWQEARRFAAEINHDENDVVDMDIAVASLKANLATLERHKGNGLNTPFCLICRGSYGQSDGQLFPCPTYADVTNYLDEVME